MNSEPNISFNSVRVEQISARLAFSAYINIELKETAAVCLSIRLFVTSLLRQEILRSLKM